MISKPELIIKECELIAGIVNRLSSQGHSTKQLAVTVWMAAMGLGWQQHLPLLHLLAAVGGVIFWWLDAFFLATERRFRQRYQTVVSALAAKPSDPDIADPLSLRTESSFGAVLRAGFSCTVWVLYLPLVVFGTLVWFNGM